MSGCSVTGATGPTGPTGPIGPAAVFKFSFTNVDYLTTTPNYGPLVNNTGRTLHILKYLNECTQTSGSASGDVDIQIGSSSGGAQFAMSTVTNATQLSTVGTTGGLCPQVNGWPPIPPGSNIWLRVSTASGGFTQLKGNFTVYCLEV